MLTAIWAQDEKGLIGNEGTLPWHLPDDLKFFKEKTIHHTIVMGRKTFEGMNSRPLPDRVTIVMTREQEYQADGVLVMHSPQEVLDYAKNHEDTLIAGGAGIFQAFMPYLDKMYRTVIYDTFKGDVYFPDIDWQEWQLVESRPGVVDEKNKYPHTFETYIRKSK